MTSGRKSRRRGLAVSVAVVAAVAGAALGMTTLLGVTFQGGGSQPAEGAPGTPRGSGLSICVEAVEMDAAGKAARGDAAIEAEAESSVEAAVGEVARHPDWEPAGLAAAPPVVDIGCPSEPLPLQTPPNVRWVNGKPQNYTGPYVEHTSYYRVFVFVFPSMDHIDHLLGGTYRREAPQEHRCLVLSDGVPTCGEVTYAIYVTPEEIQHPTPLLVDLLTQAAGLER